MIRAALCRRFLCNSRYRSFYSEQSIQPGPWSSQDGCGHWSDFSSRNQIVSRLCNQLWQTVSCGRLLNDQICPEISSWSELYKWLSHLPNTPSWSSLFGLPVDSSCNRWPASGGVGVGGSASSLTSDPPDPSMPSQRFPVVPQHLVGRICWTTSGGVLLDQNQSIA